MARSPGLSSNAEWKAWSSSVLRPCDVPSSPDGAHEESWQGWGHWLGTGDWFPSRRECRRRRRRRLSRFRPVGVQIVHVPRLVQRDAHTGHAHFPRPAAGRHASRRPATRCDARVGPAEQGRWSPSLRAGLRMGDCVHQMATRSSPPRRRRRRCAIFEMADSRRRRLRRGGRTTPRRQWRTTCLRCFFFLRARVVPRSPLALARCQGPALQCARPLCERGTAGGGGRHGGGDSSDVPSRPGVDAGASFRPVFVFSQNATKIMSGRLRQNVGLVGFGPTGKAGARA